MECIVEFLKKNMRYRVVYADRQYYLLDVEQSIWPMIFPFLFWLFPQKLHVVDGATIDKVITKTSSGNKLGIFGMIGGVSAVTLTPLVKPYIDYTFQTPFLFDVIWISVYGIGVLVFRIHLHYKLQDKIKSTIPLDSFPTRIVKIRPRYFNQFFLAIALHLFVIFFAMLSVVFYVQEGHIAGFMLLLFMFPLLTIAGSFAIHPTIGKKNVYRMKFIDVK